MKTDILRKGTPSVRDAVTRCPWVLSSVEFNGHKHSWSVFYTQVSVEKQINDLRTPPLKGGFVLL